MAELGDKIMVCIHCMTYNHEKYLADALEGFVMQKTDFPFVAVVIDDCSTDGTADVLRRYEEKYPEIIKAVYLKENYYSQHKSKQPFLEPWDSKAKYIALCEGDDYWTDPLKLQKQVDFLDSHPDYSMCFHSAKIISFVDNYIPLHVDNVEDKDYSSNDIFPKWQIPTASVLYRRSPIDNYKPLKKESRVLFGDIVLFLKCTHSGKVRGFSETMSVYRRHPTGVTNIKEDEMSEERYCNHLRFLKQNFPSLKSKFINIYLSQHYYTKSRRGSGFLQVVDLLKAIRFSPSFVIRKILRKPITVIWE